MSTDDSESKDYCLLSERPADYVPEEDSGNTLVILNREKVVDEHKKITSTLEMAVEEFKRRNPEKYDMAQLIGDDVMNKIYEDINVGRDVEGDKIKAKELFDIYNDGLLDECDMESREIELLNVYHIGWKIKL